MYLAQRYTCCGHAPKTQVLLPQNRRIDWACQTKRQPFSTSRNMGVRVTSLIQILCVAVESEKITIEGTNTIISSSSSSSPSHPHHPHPHPHASMYIQSWTNSGNLGPPNSRGLLLHLFGSTFAQVKFLFLQQDWGIEHHFSSFLGLGFL